MDASSAPISEPDAISLRKLILLKAGQDVRHCHECAKCNGNLADPLIRDTMDISLDTLVHMVLWNDEEVLSSKTVWSEVVYETLLNVCVRGLNLQAVIKVLREEARRRNI